MKRKTASVIMSAALVLSLAVLPGCTKTISGSVSEVIEQAQSIKASEKVTVEVTGRTSTTEAIKLDNGTTIIGIEDGEKYVVCTFNSEQNIGTEERVTVTGELSGSDVYDSYIGLTNCKLK
jgi:outer membrane lipoprotein-sorting protein